MLDQLQCTADSTMFVQLTCHVAFSSQSWLVHVYLAIGWIEITPILCCLIEYVIAITFVDSHVGLLVRALQNLYCTTHAAPSGVLLLLREGDCKRPVSEGSGSTAENDFTEVVPKACRPQPPKMLPGGAYRST